MFNLKNLAINPTADMPVCDAAGAPQVDAAGNPLTITFRSPGTKEYTKAKHAADEKRNGDVVARMTGKAVVRTAELEAATRAEFLAAVTVSFNGFDYDGRKGYEGIKAAYADPEIGHIADDADKFLGNRGNFMPVSPTVSPSTSDTSLG